MGERPVALVTGASRGIGEAVARELARRGYTLVLAARSREPLAALAAELTRAGAPALAIPADMRDPEALRRLADITLAQLGRVDALIHNAGVGQDGRLLAGTSAQAGDELLAVNLYAPIALTRALLPHMLARRAGSIVFIGSVAGRIALPGSALYSASKFGLRGFALALRREVARHGVQVSLVTPGLIDTAMTARLRGVPKAPPALVARVVAAALERPRRELVVPWMYRPLIAFEQLLPGLADWILRVVR
jgi:short-subunit dehydrogenase